MEREPPAQLVIISEKVLPSPVVEMTLTMRPTEHSRMAVMIMFRDPSSRAAMICFRPIRFGVSQDAPIQVRMAKPAAYVGV